MLKLRIIALALLLPGLALASPDQRIFRFAGEYQPVGQCRIYGYPVSSLSISASLEYGRNNVTVNFFGTPGSTASMGDMPVHGAAFAEGVVRENNAYNVRTTIAVNGNTLTIHEDISGTDRFTLQANGMLSTSVPGGHCSFVRSGSARAEEAAPAKTRDAGLLEFRPNAGAPANTEAPAEAVQAL
jgi:hypothetical protein